MIDHWLQSVHCTVFCNSCCDLSLTHIHELDGFAADPAILCLYGRSAYALTVGDKDDNTENSLEFA